MITNPEEAKKEQMICIELSNEIRLLQLYMYCDEGELYGSKNGKNE